MTDEAMVNPESPDPEYNTERLHTEEVNHESPLPNDYTYHAMDEAQVHDFVPADNTPVPAYTPRVSSIVPDPRYPVTEDDSFHIVSYGTVEDVAFADGTDEDDPQRKNGLVHLAVRDEYDDLLHAQIHAFNPLSLLSERNIKQGARVRIDIQDYKNVVEWFIYNYPTQLQWQDILPSVYPSDGVWYNQDTAQYVGPTHMSGRGEDWEHLDTSRSSQLYKTFLELGQMDGNKKIDLFTFLEFLKQYFHIDDIWRFLRAHEKDMRDEDLARQTRTRQLYDASTWFQSLTSHMNWPEPRGDAVFEGNEEQQSFSLRMQYSDSVHSITDGVSPWISDKKIKGGKNAYPLMKAGSIPQAFRPTGVRWIENYGFALAEPGAWELMFQSFNSIDIAFDRDGSVWVNADELPWIGSKEHIGIFNDPANGGDPEHHGYLGGIHDFQLILWTFGGQIDIGQYGSSW